MKTIIINGQKKWPVVAIIWWTHGNEICWIELIKNLSKNLKIKNWKVVLIYWNLEAINKWVRQIGMNLNRAFLEDDKLNTEQKNTYEYKRSREIMKILENCNYSLDIHSSPTIASPPMIIVENNATEIASYLPFNIICTWFDTIEPGSTEYFMNRIGKVGLWIECWNHNDPIAIERAWECVSALLWYFGMIDFKIRKYEHKRFIAKSEYKTKTTEFRIERSFSDFEPIIKWELIGRDSWEPVYAENNWYILFARDRNIIGVEWFLEMIDWK